MQVFDHICKNKRNNFKNEKKKQIQQRKVNEDKARKKKHQIIPTLRKSNQQD